MADAPWRQTAAQPTGQYKPKADFPEHRPEPPACVQNAMMTKDKKPFTYTPGGIDLSEIRSPRMARRLERNAMSEGISPSQQAPGQQRTGPLPPSALAAMQPQLPVQVFPSGKIPPPPHGGPPPPPPPPMRAVSPLPLDSFERPDMTKIIPDNPMALLRKTQGPVVKQDPILNRENYVSNNTNENVVQQRPAVPKINSQPGSIYVPPVNHNVAPQSPHDSPNSPVKAPPAFYKRQPSLQQPEPQSPPYTMQTKQTPVFDTPPQAPESPKATLSKAPAPWLKQRSQSQEVPEWAAKDQRVVTTHIDEAPPERPKQQRPWSQRSFEKPEPEWQPQNQTQHKQPELQPWQQRQAEQPHWQQKPEPQAWQQKQTEPQTWQQKQPEPQAWQQKQQEPQTWQNQQPQHAAQPTPIYQPQVGGVRKQIANREQPQQYYPNEKVEVVIVNDPPMVYQDVNPARRTQRQQPPSQNQSVRIIPVQIEGAKSNGHNNNDPRSLNRQLSWNSTPTQSNTFKVLQKITNTDGEDNEYDDAVIEHSPKTHNNFPQQNTHKMRLNQGDQELMNKFKQVPHEDQVVNRGPKVRTIPIQIEGDGPVRTFVPPSEQTAAEPKKYMGGSIPSRSFKILQAMTAPNECGPGQSDL